VTPTHRRGGRAWRTDRDQFLATTGETHCWLTEWCGGLYVDRRLPGTDKWGATADHEIPLLLGGPELLADGAVLHLAHNWCNAARSNRLRARLGGQQPEPPEPAWIIAADP
jgi:hypothetical protein